MICFVFPKKQKWQILQTKILYIRSKMMLSVCERSNKRNISYLRMVYEINGMKPIEDNCYLIVCNGKIRIRNKVQKAEMGSISNCNSWASFWLGRSNVSHLMSYIEIPLNLKRKSYWSMDNIGIISFVLFLKPCPILSRVLGNHSN